MLDAEVTRRDSRAERSVSASFLAPAGLPHNPPLMIEHLPKPEDYVAAAAHIVAVGKQEGLSFE